MIALNLRGITADNSEGITSFLVPSSFLPKIEGINLSTELARALVFIKKFSSTSPLS